MNAITRVLRWWALALLCCLVPFAARADDDPPGRVGRISAVQGGVSMYDAEHGQWVPAPLNRPLTQGDRLSTDGDGRAQIDVGSTTLRLDGGSELEVLRLDDARLRFQLHAGGLALRLRSREVADETEIVTAEARLHPLRGGHFRIERLDDSTYVTAWRGEMRVEDAEQPFTVDSGRRAEVWREGAGRLLRVSWTAVPDDDFARWAQAEDQRQERSVAQRYVSPEMTGAQDLDRYGQWEQHPDYGAVWIPSAVVAGWAPYRYGHWAWVAPWGWTWVDDAPWGFAPFHYGRWVSWGGRWCWTPGTYVARPVYAPALVAWVGGPSFSVSVQVGQPALPAVAWVPLAPREVFVPYYRATPVYAGRLNPYPPGRRLPPPQVPTGPVMYGNQAVPGAVTVVPRDVLVRREPVARAALHTPEIMKRPLPVLRTPPVAQPAAVVTPLAPGVPQREAAPHARPPRLQPVPGGAQPTAPRAPAPPVVDLRAPRPEAANPRSGAPERDEAARAAQERQQQERQQRERIQQERIQQERLQQDRQQQERAQQEHAQQERQAREQAAREAARQSRDRQNQDAAPRQAQEQQQLQARERQMQEQQRQARERQAQEAARQAQERARQEATPVAPRAVPAPMAPRPPERAPERPAERDDVRQKQPVKPGDRDVR